MSSEVQVIFKGWLSCKFLNVNFRWFKRGFVSSSALGVAKELEWGWVTLQPVIFDGHPRCQIVWLILFPTVTKMTNIPFLDRMVNIPKNPLEELCLWIGKLIFFAGNLDVWEVENTVIAKVRTNRSFRHFMSHKSFNSHHGPCLMMETSKLLRWLRQEASML